MNLTKLSCPTPLRRFSQRIADKSTDYRRLTLWNFNYIADYGFRYLNSEHSDKMWSGIYSNVHATLETIGEPEMSDFFGLWERTNDLRENEMMERILKYCAEKSFERSVFIVGAAHRNSIIQKSQAAFCAPDLRVKWDFVYY